MFEGHPDHIKVINVEYVSFYFKNGHSTSYLGTMVEKNGIEFIGENDFQLAVVNLNNTFSPVIIHDFNKLCSFWKALFV